MDNQQRTIVTEADLGWLAGIIDGEGSVLLFLGVRGAKLNNCSPQVIVGNTEKIMIERIAAICSGLGVGCYISQRQPRDSQPGPLGITRKTAYKTLYVASVVGFRRVAALLDRVNPYLVTSKKERGELILRFIRQRLAKLAIAKPDGPGRPGKFDLDDMRLIHQITALTGSKHKPLIDGLLRDFEQARRLPSAA